MAYNNYFPGCVWVRNEDVSNYYVAPNCTIPLWDINEQIIYLKSADGMGKPTVKILEYTIREDSESSELTDLRNELANLKELARVVDKLETNGNVISPVDMDYVDKISHAIKSVVTTKAMISPLDKESEIHDDTQVSELKMLLEELASRIESM